MRKGKREVRAVTGKGQETRMLECNILDCAAEGGWRGVRAEMKSLYIKAAEEGGRRKSHAGRGGGPKRRRRRKILTVR